MPRPDERTQPTVSVIIPTYNRMGYLREALDSVLAQTAAPTEVLVVDDGSTDGTGEAVATYGPPVRYLRHSQNQGVAAARNTGLQAARGDVIAWLDSDDLWEPTFLARTMSCLAKDGSLDGVYTGLTTIAGDGTVLSHTLRVEPPTALHDALVRDSFLATASLVVYKRCYDAVGGFDPALYICEDYDMWLRLAQRFCMAGIPEPLVRIRVHGSNTMADVKALSAARMAVAEKHARALQASPDDLVFRRARGYALRAIALRHLEAGMAQEGWRLFEQAVELHPAMLERLDTCYELACADQPRGRRGDVTSLDLDAAGEVLVRQLGDMLDRASPSVAAWRSVALANAHLALAMLWDQAGHWAPARRHLWRALWHYPRLVLARGVVRRMVKLHAGPKLSRVFRPAPVRNGDLP